MRFCAEIEYEGEYFDEWSKKIEQGGIHSDICWNCNPHNPDEPLSDDHRKFLHDCLDEWLDKSKGTGHFVVGHWGECECDKCRYRT